MMFPVAKTLLKISVGLTAAALAFTGIAPAKAADAPAPIGKSSVGLQMFGWNWNSIAKECTTTLGPEGIDWVLTLPPTDHIKGNEWWIHYQPTSYELNSDAGTRAQFANMVSTCAAAGVNVVTDAVVNHMAGNSGTSFSGVEYGRNLEFAGIYKNENFHRGLPTTDPNYCNLDIVDWDTLWERTNCQFPGLPDLATEQPYVRKQIANYLNDQLALGVAGFRIDAAKHMNPADIAAIQALLTKPDAFMVQEVPGGTDLANEYTANGHVWAWDNAQLALDMFQYPGKANRGKLYDVIDTPDYPDTNVALTWVTNHDTEHHASGSVTYDNGRLYELANIWMLSEKYGSPMLYTGYAFSNGDLQAPQGPTGLIKDAVCAPGTKINTAAKTPTVGSYKTGSFVCLQRWTSIKGMIAWRDAVGEAVKTNKYGIAGVYGFGRSGKGYVLINSIAASYKAPNLETGMAAGTYCDMITGGAIATTTKKVNKKTTKVCKGATVVVSATGKISTTVPALSAIAIAATNKLK